MGRCKQGEAECGKDLCCFDCKERDGCNDVCNQCANPKGCADYESDANDLTPFQQSAGIIVAKVADLETRKAAIEAEEKAFKEQLLAAMETYGVKKYEMDGVSFTYVAPTTRSTIDGKTLKAKYPGIAEECTKVSNVSASVRIKVEK